MYFIECGYGFTIFWRHAVGAWVVLGDRRGAVLLHPPKSGRTMSSAGCVWWYEGDLNVEKEENFIITYLSKIHIPMRNLGKNPTGK